MREFRYNNLDAIRLFAAVQVVIVHTAHHLGVDPGNAFIGWLRLFPGVPIFFVVSGFLIAAAFERSRSLPVYFSNRALRIFPALWVCLLISVLMAWSAERFSLTSTDFLIWVGTQVSFLQFYHPDFLQGFGVGVLNGSLWTIPVEIQFYLLLPVIVSVLRYFNWSWVLCVIAIVVLIGLNRYDVSHLNDDALLPKLLHVSILPHLYIFFVGILLQRYFKYVVDFACDYFWLILVAYLAIAYACSLLGISYRGYSINPVSALLLAFLVLGAGYAKVPKVPLLRGCDISYGVYIYHMPFVNVMLEIPDLSGYQRFFWVLMLTFLAATASWVCVEKPALSLKLSSIRTRQDYDAASNKIIKKNVPS